jgi:hypothetical protein
MKRFLIRLPLALLVLVGACSGSVATDDATTDPFGIPRPRPPSVCEEAGRSFVGSDGSNICALYDSKGILSQASSQDAHGVYHRLDVEYPSFPLGNCVSGDLKFSEGTSSANATEIFGHSFLVCWDLNTGEPVAETLQYYAPGIGTYSYKVDGFDYNSHVAHARSSYLDAASNTSSTLHDAQLNLNFPDPSSAFSPNDVPNLFPTQIDKAAFFSVVLAGTLSFQPIQIDRVSSYTCLQAANQQAGLGTRLGMECELGGSLANDVHAQFTSSLTWVDYFNPGGMVPALCPMVFLDQNKEKPIKCGN